MLYLVAGTVLEKSPQCVQVIVHCLGVSEFLGTSNSTYKKCFPVYNSELIGGTYPLGSVNQSRLIGFLPRGAILKSLVKDFSVDIGIDI